MLLEGKKNIFTRHKSSLNGSFLFFHAYWIIIIYF